MRKFSIILLVAFILGISSPPIVKALTNVTIQFKDADSGLPIFGSRVVYFGEIRSDNKIAQYRVAESYNGYTYVPYDLTRDDPATVSYGINTSGFEYKQEILTMVSGNKFVSNLTPKVACGDYVCTPGKEVLLGCPVDCAKCGDNACSQPPENRVNCAVDCNVPKFIRGDVDGNGKVDLVDSGKITGWLYTGGASITCMDAADANDDGKVDNADVVTLSDLVGKRILALKPPFASAGYDPTPDNLKCQKYP